MTTHPTDKAAPMASAPIKYDPDGSVAWGEMWDSFCALPREGGPPHRATRLEPAPDADPASPAYQAVVAELLRGAHTVSGLAGAPAEPGWVALRCESAGMARWLSEAIGEENVAARCAGPLLLVPAGAGYTLGGEIKNVITAVAKTTHYWREHLAPEVKRAMHAQEQIGELWRSLRGLLRRATLAQR